MKQNGFGKKCAVGIALLAVMLLMLAVNSMQFLYFTDEADNFLAGMSVAAGKTIYVDFTSQHMPLLYYICGIFSLLGASNMLQFRLCFYVLFALLWVLFCLRNRDRISWFPLILIPVLYVANMIGEYNVCALSDQLQAYGMAVLFFEFCRFYDTKTVDWKASLWVAAGICVSFGSAFVSAFSIFAIVLGVIGVEIRLNAEHKQPFLQGLGAFFRKYALLLLLTLAPFLLWVLYYAVTGHLGELIFGAYRLNTEYYPAYSGYESNPLVAFINPFISYIRYLIYLIKNLPAHKLLYARELLCYGVNVLFLVHTWRQAKWKAAVLFCFAIWAGNRAFGSVFHALPYYAVSLCMLICLLWEYRKRKTIRDKSLWSVLALAVIAFLLPFLLTLGNIKTLPEEWRRNMTVSEESYEAYLQKLTQEEEDVLYATVDFYLAVNAQRLNADVPVNVPWTYDAYYEKLMRNLKEDSPRVMLFAPNYNTWGYALKDYAADAWDYLRENYQCLYLPSCPELYVRNDYYEEARVICDAIYRPQEVYEDGTEVVTVPAFATLTQTIIGSGETVDCIGFLLNTCYDLGGIRGELRVLSDSGEELAKSETDFYGWRADGFYYFEIEPLNLEAGVSYTLELTVESQAAGTGVALYATEDGKHDTAAAISGEALNADICYGLFRISP